MLVPDNPLLRFNSKYDKVFKDIDNYEIKDVIEVLQMCFEDIVKSEEMFYVDVDNTEAFDAYDPLDYDKSKNTLSLLIYINKLNLHDYSFNNFIEKIKKNYPAISSSIENIDLFDNNFTSDEELLNTFSNENFFYLDYLTLTINQKKYTLFYLLFMFKILKITKEYNNYYAACNNKIPTYNKVIYDYHIFINSKFNNLSKSLNHLMLAKVDLAILDFNLCDPLGSIDLKNKKNTSTYFIHLNKYNNNKNLLDNNFSQILQKNLNYQKFLEYFEKYQTQQFDKVDLGSLDIETFDSFVYSNIHKESLQNSLSEQAVRILQFLQYYKFNEKGVLDNFSDINFYLYQIPGYEIYQNDIYLFFDYKNSDLLKFSTNDNNIFEKIEFQANYSILYFNYIIKLFKDRKTYFFNTYIENVLFEDAEFYYQNLNFDMHEKKNELLFVLQQFLKGFKTLVLNKRTNMIEFLNNQITIYSRGIEKIKLFNFEMLYNKNILNILDTKNLYDLEVNLKSIVDLVEFQIGKLEKLRKEHIKGIY
jgi:hypothetical protein